MSHEHELNPNYAGPVPTEPRPPRVTGTNPPPPQLSPYLEPVAEPPRNSAEDTDVVVIDDEEPPAPTKPLRGPKSRPHLPYGQGWRKEPGAPAPGPEAKPPATDQMSGEMRLKILDTWMRSGLPAGDFAPLVHVSKHTLYAWKQRFEDNGPAGLMEQPRGANRGSRLPEMTKRAILLMKQMHNDWGVDRISDMLLRTQALQASPPAVAKVLAEDGYIVEHAPMHRHDPPVHTFERSRPNELWQTDLFTFMLKRQNQRVYLVGFMDDQSRFLVSYGLHTSQSGALVIETLRAGIGAFGTPQEILTDNGSQYITWRGTSQFQHECRRRGIKQIVARPHRPQTLGKIERFWGSLWRECVDAAVFQDLADARTRIGHYIDYYNFQRAHQGINGMVPADRFFSSTPAVLDGLRQRVSANALELARHGMPKTPMYLTGNVGGTSVVLHAEGDRMMLSKDGARTEIDFDPRPIEPVPLPTAAVAQVASGWTGAVEQPPGASALDGDALSEPVETVGGA